MGLLGALDGYKTYIGAAMVAASAVLDFLGYADLAEQVLRLGEALGILGIGHKMVKMSVR